MIALLLGCAFAVATGIGIGWSVRSRRPCRTCAERAEAEAALEAIRREPETLERLKGLKVDPAAIKARIDAAGAALRESGLDEEIFVGDQHRAGGGAGWRREKNGKFVFCTWTGGGKFSDESACRYLPALLAEAEKRLRARNKDLRAAGIEAP